MGALPSEQPGSLLNGTRQSQMNSLLVIDDDPVHRMIIARLGAQAGMHVEVACSALEARRKLIENRFRCVTLDLNLGEDEGASVLQSLAESIPAPQVLLISGADQQARRLVMSMGRRLMLDLLDVPKPIDLKILRQKLEAAAQPSSRNVA